MSNVNSIYFHDRVRFRLLNYHVVSVVWRSSAKISTMDVCHRCLVVVERWEFFSMVDDRLVVNHSNYLQLNVDAFYVVVRLYLI